MSWYNNILYACTLCILTVHAAESCTRQALYLTCGFERLSYEFLPLPVLHVLWPYGRVGSGCFVIQMIVVLNVFYI